MRPVPKLEDLAEKAAPVRKPPELARFTSFLGQASLANKEFGRRLDAFNSTMHELAHTPQSWGGWANTKQLKIRLAIKRKTGR